jgi:hypothetical protein
MAKGLKFTATDSDGGVHKRSSQSREYAYTVVAKASYNHAMVVALELRKVDLDNFGYCFAMAFKGGYDSRGMWLAPRNEKERQGYEDSLLGCKDAKSYQRKLVEKRRQGVEALLEAGFYDRWQNQGWCSRRDLAENLASNTRNKPYWAKVEILIADRA